MLVIFKRFDNYAVTTEENYNAQIMDARKVTPCKDFTSPKEIIEYFSIYFGKNASDFLIKA